MQKETVQVKIYKTVNETRRRLMNLLIKQKKLQNLNLKINLNIELGEWNCKAQNKTRLEFCRK